MTRNTKRLLWKVLAGIVAGLTTITVIMTFVVCVLIATNITAEIVGLTFADLKPYGLTLATISSLTLLFLFGAATHLVCHVIDEVMK